MTERAEREREAISDLITSAQRIALANWIKLKIIFPIGAHIQFLQRQQQQFTARY